MRAVFLLIGFTIFNISCTPTIKVETPDKPLEINMNVKIDHQIKVKVDKQLESVMNSNSDIF
jgi:hypothetical protein